jgi:putative transposase
MNDNLSHTSWKCKYHIVFAPKYRRKNIYGVLKSDIGKILRQLCDLKKVEIHEAEACPDHIHMLVSIPPNISVSQFMGYLKGKSSLMIFDRHANLKYKYGNRHFWCRGYYVNTVGADARAITAYIQNQLAEDQAYEQLTFREYIDPFTGSKDPQAFSGSLKNSCAWRTCSEPVSGCRHHRLEGVVHTTG